MIGFKPFQDEIFSMLLYLIILLLALPFVDLYLLIEVTGRIGFIETLGLVFLTGILGAFFVKREAKTVWRKLGVSVTANEVSRNVLEGAMIVLGGLMLLSPGFITDAVGFLLVIGWTRIRIVLKIEEKMKEKSNFKVQVQQF
ncbi:MAG: hypothetical protein BRC29_00635 [Nanohaloarchaea archaeon SW_7_43_1]|nr:MAG: hypothetical protein BRC29_00635 [Nanohaloarchaea archaeon SW_7_43_1]